MASCRLEIADPIEDAPISLGQRFGDGLVVHGGEHPPTPPDPE
jgi:hypothetical protein